MYISVHKPRQVVIFFSILPFVTQIRFSCDENSRFGYARWHTRGTRETVSHYLYCICNNSAKTKGESRNNKIALAEQTTFHTFSARLIYYSLLWVKHSGKKYRKIILHFIACRLCHGAHHFLRWHTPFHPKLLSLHPLPPSLSLSMSQSGVQLERNIVSDLRLLANPLTSSIFMLHLLRRNEQHRFISSSRSASPHSPPLFKCKTWIWNCTSGFVSLVQLNTIFADVKQKERIDRRLVDVNNCHTFTHYFFLSLLLRLFQAQRQRQFNVHKYLAHLFARFTVQIHGNDVRVSGLRLDRDRSACVSINEEECLKNRHLPLTNKSFFVSHSSVTKRENTTWDTRWHIRNVMLRVNPNVSNCAIKSSIYLIWRKNSSKCTNITEASTFIAHKTMLKMDEQSCDFRPM